MSRLAGKSAVPPLNADGSLRPATRVKPRCGISPPSALRFWFLNIAGTAAAKGAKPARSAIPGPLEDIAPGLGESPGPCGSARCRATPFLRYHLTASIAIKATSASPAAPPTTPPAMVPAGGVLLPPPEFEFLLDADSVLAGAANVVEASLSVPAIVDVVCLALLEDASADDADMDTMSVVLDARDKEEVSAADTVKVLPSRTVV